MLPGTTYWHNQWLSLGHVPMEMTMLKAVRSPELNVTRVVVQRVVMVVVVLTVTVTVGRRQRGQRRQRSQHRAATHPDERTQLR